MPVSIEVKTRAALLRPTRLRPAAGANLVTCRVAAQLRGGRLEIDVAAKTIYPQISSITRSGGSELQCEGLAFF